MAHQACMLVLPALLLGLALYIQLNSAPVSPPHLPITMRALRLHSPSSDGHSLGKVSVDEVAMPDVLPGYVLIHVQAAPINPSDVYFMYGTYGGSAKDGNSLTYPRTCGLEGSGLVIGSGGGFLASVLVGSRVSFVSGHGGAYAEYVVAKADEVVPLVEDVTFEQGASGVVNPLTAIGMTRIAQDGDHQAIVHTAAASALGKMLVRLCKHSGIRLLNIVRRQSQKDLLIQEGAAPEDVFVSTATDYEETFRAAAKAAGATIAFDAIAGEASGHLLSLLPEDSVMHVYGCLSEAPVGGIDPIDMMMGRKRVEGYHLKVWTDSLSLLNKGMNIWTLRGLLKDTLSTTYSESVGLEEIPRAVEEYMAGATNKKVLVRPAL